MRISETEYMNIQFPGAAELYRGIRRGSYPNYAWFDINKLENLKSVVDGAGTVRQMARLSAWYHYPKIRDAIEKQLNALRSESVATFMREHYGSEIDDGINVHIVFGLGGGTGSALGPAEIPYLVRKILRDMGIVGAHQLIGYGVLPQAFKDLTGANALANGYAALKESTTTATNSRRTTDWRPYLVSRLGMRITCATASIAFGSPGRLRMTSATCWMRATSMWTSTARKSIR